LDYGAEALDSAGPGALAKFDALQYRALKICCGAMTGTALEALQNECGELPLALRRRRQQLRHSVKILSTPDHPASSVLMDHWANHYGRRTQTIYAKVKDFFEIYDWKLPIIDLKPDVDPPWTKDPFCVDCSLSTVLSKSDPELNCKVLALDMIEGYSDRLHIYTDGSKDKEGHVACSVWVPERKESVKLRLPDNLSVFTAELVAIREALVLARDYCNAGESRNIAIFSDSLSVVQSLDSSRPHSRPDILKQMSDLKKSFTESVMIAWIPSHVGIGGNEMADEIAKEAVNHPTVDKHIALDRVEILNAIDKYVIDLWQDRWSTSGVARHNNIIQPTVSAKVKFADPNRRKEVALTRLRLGVCKLKKYLKTQGNHPTGLCDACGVPETIEHFLMHCRGNNISSELLTICNRCNVTFDLQSILNNRVTLQAIYDNLNISL